MKRELLRVATTAVEIHDGSAGERVREMGVTWAMIRAGRIRSYERRAMATTAVEIHDGSSDERVRETCEHGR